MTRISEIVRVSIDLCQRGVRDTSGAWLSVTPGPADGTRLERLQRLLARTPLWEQPVAGEGDPLHEVAPEGGALPCEPGAHEDFVRRADAFPGTPTVAHQAWGRVPHLRKSRGSSRVEGVKHVRISG